MDTFVRNNSQFYKARQIHVHNGAQWYDCVKVWVHDGGQWYQVFQKFIAGFLAAVNYGASEWAQHPNDQVASRLTFRSDGSILGTTSWSENLAWQQGYAEVTRWGTPLMAGAGAAYYVKWQVAAQVGTYLGSLPDTWHSIGSEPYIERLAQASGTYLYPSQASVSGTVYLATAPNDGAIISSVGFSLSAESLLV